MVTLTGSDQAALVTLLRTQSAEQRLVRRAQILLTAAVADHLRGVAHQVGVSPETVRTWCARWTERRTQDPTGAAEALLPDAPRPGRPFVYTADQRLHVVLLACRPPAPASVWSVRDLTGAVRKETHTAMSAYTVWKTLADADLKPHNERMWLHRTDPNFAAKQQAICNLYLGRRRRGQVILSFDEKTGMQATEHRGPHRHPAPGQVARKDYEYRRHGTLSLLAAFDSHTGRVQGWTFPRHTHAECLTVLDRLDARYGPRTREIVLIGDNLAVHKHAAVQAWLTTHPRWRFVFTPTHASWLNQIEIWFGILHRKLLRHGEVGSVDTLAAQVAAFIRAYNRTAHAFRWTYQGTPLQA